MKTLASTCPICFTAYRRCRVLWSCPAWAEGLRQHDHRDHHGHPPDHHHFAVQVSPAIEVVVYSSYSQGKFLHFNIKPIEIGLRAFVISVWGIIDWLDLVEVMLSRVSSLRAAALAEERELQVCQGPIIGNSLICVVLLFWTWADWSGLIIKWATGTEICCAK